MSLEFARPQILLDPGYPELSQGFPQGMKLKSGDTLMVSGEPMRLYVFDAADTQFQAPGDPTSIENQQRLTALEILSSAAQISQRLADRLFDPEDGLTYEAVSALVDGLEELPPEFAQKIQGYLLTLAKFGGNLHPTRGSVVIPPCTRSEFEIGLRHLKDQQVEWGRWLDAMYDAVPSATQGFFLYRSPEERRILRESIPSFSEKAAEVREIFEKAVAEQTISDADRIRYDRSSQELAELEVQKLTPALEACKEAQAMSTRVYITVDADGNPSMEARHYSAEFRADLDEMARKLDLAAQCLPKGSGELREVLSDLSLWCKTPSSDPNWGQARPSWVNAKSREDLLDVVFLAEEKGSHLGSKGVFHFAVSQHTEPPRGLEEVWELLVEEGRKHNVNTLLLRTLIVGGFNSHYVVSGEKLPDPAGQPMYKSMTFKNTTGVAQVVSQGDAIAAATGLTLDQVLEMQNVMTAAVALHERGHTLGDHAEFLGALGNSVEETNAQGSAVYLASRFIPESLDRLLVLETCWMPVRRVRQGPTEPHSRSDIVLFEEYLRAGAIAIEPHEDRLVVRVKDPDVAVAVAHHTALKMRLWEKGLPERMHPRFVEPLDPSDSSQDARITGRVAEYIASLRPEQQQAMREKVLDEVAVFFSNDRLRWIGAKLAPVIRGMTAAQALPVFPSDKRLARLVSQNRAGHSG